MRDQEGLNIMKTVADGEQGMEKREVNRWSLQDLVSKVWNYMVI